MKAIIFAHKKKAELRTKLLRLYGVQPQFSSSPSSALQSGGPLAQPPPKKSAVEEKKEEGEEEGGEEGDETHALHRLVSRAHLAVVDQTAQKEAQKRPMGRLLGALLRAKMKKVAERAAQDGPDEQPSSSSSSSPRSTTACLPPAPPMPYIPGRMRFPLEACDAVIASRKLLYWYGTRARTREH